MVVQILGKAFKKKQAIHIALASKFYGIGLPTAIKICSKIWAFIHGMRNAYQLSESYMLNLTTMNCLRLTIEDDASSENRANIALKRSIGSSQGFRLENHLHFIYVKRRRSNML